MATETATKRMEKIEKFKTSLDETRDKWEMEHEARLSAEDEAKKLLSTVSNQSENIAELMDELHVSISN